MAAEPAAEGGRPESKTIPASLVKQLRDQTGAGMMDVKRALEETDGDLEAAQASSFASAAWRSGGKRAGRDDLRGRRAGDGRRGHVGTIAPSAARPSRSRKRPSSRRSPSSGARGGRGRRAGRRRARGRARRAVARLGENIVVAAPCALRRPRRGRSPGTSTRRRIRSACCSREGNPDSPARSRCTSVRGAAVPTRDEVPDGGRGRARHPLEAAAMSQPSRRA